MEMGLGLVLKLVCTNKDICEWATEGNGFFFFYFEEKKLRPGKLMGWSLDFLIQNFFMMDRL